MNNRQLRALKLCPEASRQSPVTNSKSVDAQDSVNSNRNWSKCPLKNTLCKIKKTKEKMGKFPKETIHNFNKVVFVVSRTVVADCFVERLR